MIEICVRSTDKGTSGLTSVGSVLLKAFRDFHTLTTYQIKRFPTCFRSPGSNYDKNRILRRKGLQININFEFRQIDVYKFKFEFLFFICEFRL